MQSPQQLDPLSKLLVDMVQSFLPVFVSLKQSSENVCGVTHYMFMLVFLFQGPQCIVLDLYPMVVDSQSRFSCLHSSCHQIPIVYEIALDLRFREIIVFN